MEIIQSISIENTIAKRDAAVARLQALVEDLDKADSEIRQLCGSTLPDITNGKECVLFNPTEMPKAIKAMDSTIWQRLLLESGIRSFMSSVDRDKWDRMIWKKEVPELTLDNVRATFGELYAKRGEMFIDGIEAVYRSLSWCHKTNEPFAFGPKVIIGGLWTDKGQYLSSHKCNVLDDLLRAFHLLDGKPEPDARNGMNGRIAEVNCPPDYYCHEQQRRVLKWEPSDHLEDTYFSLKWYKKSGTAHLKFKRQDLVDRMNLVLGSRFPNAVASDIRNPSNLPEAAAVPKARTLSRAVLDALRQLRRDGDAVVGLPQLDRTIYEQVDEVLQSLGGQWNRSRGGHVFAGVDMTAVETELRHINRDSAWFCPADFGFFPTPDELVDHLLAMADVGPGMTVLEPSAGRGAIVKRLLELGCRVHAIEAMRTNVPYLRKLDCKLNEGDFLEMRVDPEARHDAVVMNPPFANHQDIAHVMRAMHWLKPGGRLVSVMSASVKYSNDRYAKMFRSFVADFGELVDLPSGSFKASGTMVNTVAVILTKPDPAKQIRAPQAPAVAARPAVAEQPQLLLA